MKLFICYSLPDLNLQTKLWFIDSIKASMVLNKFRGNGFYKLQTALLKLGFSPSKADPSLFVYIHLQTALFKLTFFTS